MSRIELVLPRLGERLRATRPRLLAYSISKSVFLCSCRLAFGAVVGAVSRGVSLGDAWR